ncbi:MAG: DUF192 domain-containing protein [Clostridia bacterium]
MDRSASLAKASKGLKRQVVQGIAAVLCTVLAAVAFPALGSGLPESSALIARYCEPEDGLRRGVTEAWCAMELSRIRLRGSDEDGPEESVSLEVLVAADERSRLAGYQWIDPALAGSTATLFLFPRPVHGAFHMCNVDAPLWIVWYREDGSPLDVALMLPGQDVPAALCRDLYAPRRPETYRYALEIGVELAQRLGLDRQRLSRLRLELEPWMNEAR